MDQRKRQEDIFCFPPDSATHGDYNGLAVQHLPSGDLIGILYIIQNLCQSSGHVFIYGIKINNDKSM